MRQIDEKSNRKTISPRGGGCFRTSVALGFIAFLGAAHILIRTGMYGVVYHDVADAHIADAKAFAAGQIFEETASERVLLWFPPLFTAIMSLYRLLGVEPSDIGRYVNVISFGLIIIVVSHWLHRLIRFRFVMIGSALTIAVSYPLTRVSSQLFSDTLFVLMALLALINLESFLSGRKVGKVKSGFWLLTVFSALAFLTRYLGVTVIFIGVLFILMHRGTSTSTKWKQAALYGVVSSLPTALWMTRNWIFNGNITGRERKCTIGQSLGESLSQLGESLSRLGDHLHLWIFVRHGLGWLDICLWAAALLAGFEAVKALTINVRSERRRLFQKTGSLLDIKERSVLPFTAFAIVYLVVLLVVAPYTTCEPPTAPRYLLPIYVPAVMTAAVWLERFLLKTYSISGISVYKNSDSWGINYLKTSGPVATIRWIIIGLILAILLTSFTRNIVLYTNILTTYNPTGYQF